MKEKTYLINEKRFKELLMAKFKLEALECGGVDNWEYYDESIQNYLDEDESFETLAVDVLKAYNEKL